MPMNKNPQTPRPNFTPVGICHHSFVYGGIRFEITDLLLPGSGARYVYYYDWFYCPTCLANRYQKLSIETNTYEPVRYGATPKAEP